MAADNDRDALLNAVLPLYGEDSGEAPEDTVDRIVSLGFTRPRVVETVEQAEAVPDGTVIRDQNGDVSERQGRGIEMTGVVGRWTLDWIKYPARVLFTPEGSD